MNFAVISNLFLVLYLSQATGQQTYRANEFFAAFPKNGNFIPLQTPKLHITTTEDSPVLVTITTLLNIEYTVTVQPHTSKSVVIQDDLILESNTDINKGIRIKAETGKLVSVYATNYVITQAGGYTVLPLHYYDIPEYVYYAFSTKTSDSANGFNSIVVLLSGNDNTSVTISPTQDVTIPAEITKNGSIIVSAGSTYTVSLDAMSTLLLSNTGDLTGTKVMSNKPLSVISGHECGIVPPFEDYCDHMLEQIPPSVTWGKQYMSMPFAKRQSGALFKILTERPNNQINITCNDVTSNQRNITSLNLTTAGEFVSHIISNDEWCSFVSRYPTIITQYAFGGLQENIGDPLSMVLTPIEQYSDLKLRDIITPESLFADSYSSHKEHVIGIFVLGDEIPENITLDSTVDLDEHNWRAIYNGDDVLGYGLAVEGINESSHFISGSSLSSPLFVSVIFYGFTAEFNGFGFPANGGLEPISMPWLVAFSQNNYTIIENAVYTIPVHSMNPIDTPLSLTVQTCPGTQPLANVVFDNTVNFNPGDLIQYIMITATDDKNIEELEATCLEITTSSNQSVYLYPINQVNIFIKDDDGVQLSLAEVKMIADELELTLRLTGYEGETNGSVTVTATIADSINDIPQALTTITSFDVYFTKYLAEVKYLLPFNSPVTDDSIVAITVSHTELNVSVGVNNIPLLQPAPLPSVTTYTSSSEIIQQSTATLSVTSASSSQSATAIPNVRESKTLTIEPVTTMAGHSGTVVVDLYVVYLIVGLISILGIVVFILITTIICFFKMHQRRYQISDIEKRGLKKATLSTTELLVTETKKQPNSQGSYSQDSAVYADSFSRSTSPNRSDSPGSEESVEQGKTHHIQRLNDIVDESSPRHSMAGSKDNLLQQQSTAV